MRNQNQAQQIEEHFFPKRPWEVKMAYLQKSSSFTAPQSTSIREPSISAKFQNFQEASLTSGSINDLANHQFPLLATSLKVHSPFKRTKVTIFVDGSKPLPIVKFSRCFSESPALIEKQRRVRKVSILSLGTGQDKEDGIFHYDNDLQGQTNRRYSYQVEEGPNEQPASEPQSNAFINSSIIRFCSQGSSSPPRMQHLTVSQSKKKLAMKGAFNVNLLKDAPEKTKKVVETSNPLLKCMSSWKGMPASSIYEDLLSGHDLEKAALSHGIHIKPNGHPISCHAACPIRSKWIPKFQPLDPLVLNSLESNRKKIIGLKNKQEIESSRGSYTFMSDTPPLNNWPIFSKGHMRPEKHNSVTFFSQKTIRTTSSHTIFNSVNKERFIDSTPQESLVEAFGQIEKDVERSFPGWYLSRPKLTIMKKAGQNLQRRMAACNSLERMLQMYVLIDSETGYTQGLNLVGAVILYHLEDSNLSLAFLKHLMYNGRVRQMHASGMIVLQELAKDFWERYLRSFDPVLSDALASISPLAIVPGYYLCLFANIVDLPHMVGFFFIQHLVIDLYLEFKHEFLHSFMLSILIYMREELLRAPDEAIIKISANSLVHARVPWLDIILVSRQLLNSLQ